MNTPTINVENTPTIIVRIAALLFAVFLMEASAIPGLTVTIPGIPLTLGRLSLVVLGVLGFFASGTISGTRAQVAVVLLICAGALIGSLLSSSITQSLSAWLGFSLLFVTAMMSSTWLHSKIFQRLLVWWSVACLAYWCFYILSIREAYGSVSYGAIYRVNQDDDNSLINYHSFGSVISVAGIFLSQFIGDVDKRVRALSIIAPLIVLFLLVISESRSNLLVFIAVLAVAFFFFQSGLKKYIFVTIISALALGFLANLVGQDESLTRRYDISNTDYIGYTTASRTSLSISAIESILSNPLGQGFTVNRVEYRGGTYQPHNQFLTLGLASGFTGLIASAIWILATFKLLRIGKNSTDPSTRALALSLFTITLTLFTNDISGAMFFFAVTLLGYSGLPPGWRKNDGVR
jgi:hypothetical protein